ncbi:hypothetical protein TKK_0002121 [Trichogramma kaykai]|uniref:Sfi1 spindle body domain-containing protein n=1 Tax=Trichogramma kaykai TaxID=54128 RepID=A0ABD2XCM3_9HYME
MVELLLPEDEVIKVSIRPVERPAASRNAIDAPNNNNNNNNNEKPVVADDDLAEASLRGALAALRLHALQERRLRELEAMAKERRRRKTLRRCLGTWRAWLERCRERAVKQAGPERKIELLVSALGERQQQQQQKPLVAVAKKPNSAAENNKSRSSSKRLSSVAGGPAHNRLQAQRRIIEEQRARLLKQTRLIQELKLREIEKEARRAEQTTLEVARQALERCDEQLTRRGIEHLLRGDEAGGVANVPVGQQPGFLTRMQLRAEARKQRMIAAQEARQRRLEEQRAREQARLQQNEERQRRIQIQALKEARKLRQQLEQRRHKELEKGARLDRLAEQFYRRYLLRRYALRPLRGLVRETARRFELAEEHYGLNLKLKIFEAWRSDWTDRQNAKILLARKMYRHNLLWYAFERWKNLALDLRRKLQVAKDFYDMKLQAGCWRAWRDIYLEFKKQERSNEDLATGFYETSLKRKYFQLWCKYVTIADDIKQRELRRQEWRGLISKFMPKTPPISKLHNNHHHQQQSLL